MGEIKKVTVGQNRVRALMLYEVSVEQNNVPPSLPALRGKVVGSMEEIQCTICKYKRDWIIGQDGMQELLSHVT